MTFYRRCLAGLILLIGAENPARAASISWTSGVVPGDEIIRNGGELIEAGNFGNSSVSSPVINGVQFQGIDFSSGQSPQHLTGLSYNTGENGKRPGVGFNELFDTIAYRSGSNLQIATLTGLEPGTEYEVQFFYYHDTVNRSVTIRGADGGDVILSENGMPLHATGLFTADAGSQSLIFDANVGSQFLNAYQLREHRPKPPLVLGEVVISEFVASNKGGLKDGNGKSSDWIEIWNSTSGSVDLAGWFLTTSPAHDSRWSFPSITLSPDQRFLVFASGREEEHYVGPSGYLHTNFKLAKNGGYLALLKTDLEGKVNSASEYVDFPSQKSNVSYGMYGSEVPLKVGYLERTTPGLPNSDQGFNGFAGDTSFSQDRGFYDEPFWVTIRSEVEGATIRYTLDGSEPTPANGLDYPGGLGIEITKTTTLRAAAFKEGFQPSNVDTQTYLFPEDIVEQPSDPAGFPSDWTGADYGMDNDPVHLGLIAGDPGLDTEGSKSVIQEALQELPTLSLVMDVEDWFGDSGIYSNSTARGAEWERKCSAELIFPNNLEGDPFQIDCGVRVQGNTSRNAAANPKHSLRISFRSEYGESKLRYPFFGEDSPSVFDTIVLRSNSQDGWVYHTARNRLGQFVRDAWARETHRRMGHASPDSNWVHLFINGLYWGVYNPTERPDASYGESHYGGDKEDWDAIKNHEEVLDGNRSAYGNLLSLIQNDPDNWNAGYRDLSGPEDYGAIRSIVDVEMLIDYMIHNMYAAADDWPGNFYMGFDRSRRNGGWKFYDWDNEHGMKNPVDLDRTRPHSRDDDSPTKFHHALKSNPEYRQLFGDRLHKAFFNGGVLYVDPEQPNWDPLNPGRNVPAALWMSLTGEIEQALIAESARWGDYRKSTPYTVFNEFETLRNDLLENWFPARSLVVFDQFRAQGFYPNIEAPVFNQFGGSVANGFSLEMTGPEQGAIYFTTDGSDPRIPVYEEVQNVVLAEDSEVSILVPQSDLGLGWTHISYDDEGWKKGTGGVGYEIFPGDYHPFIGVSVPEMYGANESLYIRYSFEIESEDALAEVASLILEMSYDDGFVAYLNGVKVASANAPDSPEWQSGATQGHADDLAVTRLPFDISQYTNHLQVGKNILAVHGLNLGARGSDFLISPRIVSVNTDAAGVSPFALRYRNEINLAESGVVRARVLQEGEWSALTEAGFIVGVPATAGNLVVSEIMYHGEEGDQYDYIELMNISGTDSIQLGGAGFTEGIKFEFPLKMVLNPGERLLLVENETAFEARYGALHRIAGQFTGNLDNGGERLAISGIGGALIQDFSYDDKAPWPETVDGRGYSLVLINPQSNPSHGDPESWRASVAIGGSPGQSDSSQFTGEADKDEDGDSIPALLEYALGSSDLEADHNMLPKLAFLETGMGSEFAFTRNPGADDLVYHVETSRDLISWAEIAKEGLLINRGYEADGKYWVRYVLPGGVDQFFLRLRVSLR